MSELVRFGVSIENSLLEAFDRYIEQRGYRNRSEAIRDLIRDRLVRGEWEAGTTSAVGALCMVYDHDAHDLAHRLAHIQHESVDQIISTLHVHLDRYNCLEVLVLRGQANRLRQFADRIIATRGVKHGQLVMTAGEPGSRPGGRKETRKR